MDLGPRDIIPRVMVTEFEAGRGFKGPYGDYMHLDVRHLGEEVVDRKLPFMRKLGRGYMGIDIVNDPIPIRPVEHYMMGGIDADIHGATPGGLGLRRRQELASRADGLRAELRRRGRLAAHIVYECEDRGERFLGRQRCDGCNRFCPAVGLGGALPRLR